MLRLMNTPCISPPLHSRRSFGHRQPIPGAGARILCVAPGAQHARAHRSRRSITGVRSACRTARQASAHRATAHLARDGMSAGRCAAGGSDAAHGRSLCGAIFACSARAVALVTQTTHDRAAARALRRSLRPVGGASGQERSPPAFPARAEGRRRRGGSPRIAAHAPSIRPPAYAHAQVTQNDALSRR